MPSRYDSEVNIAKSSQDSSRNSRRSNSQVSSKKFPGFSDTDFAQLEAAVGAARAPLYAKKLLEAERTGNYGDDMLARRLAREVLRVIPDSNAARHIAAMASYRLQRWTDAIKDLEILVSDGETEVIGLLGDCYRAKGLHGEVEKLWTKCQSSPHSTAVGEMRMAYAGSLADRGQIREAIELLSKVRINAARPTMIQARVAYFLADLFESAGEVAKARRFFKIAALNPDADTDAEHRMSLI